MSVLKGRVGSAHVIALLALVVAMGGTAYAVDKIGTKEIKNGAVTSAKLHKKAVTSAKLASGSVTPSKMSEYTNSGLVKLSNGQNQVLLTRGPFKLTAKCVDAGAGSSTASMVAKNTGTGTGLFESDYESNYADPTFEPGEVLNAFYETTDSNPYWFGEYYNMFSVTSGNGKTSLYGGGNIGVKVLGADCAFQLWTLGK